MFVPCGWISWRGRDLLRLTDAPLIFDRPIPEDDEVSSKQV